MAERTSPRCIRRFLPTLTTSIVVTALAVSASGTEFLGTAPTDNMYVGQGTMACDCDHGRCDKCTWIRGGVDYLYLSRSGTGTGGPLVVGGPDAFRVGDGLDLGEQSGWRLWASMNVLDWTVEAIFTDPGTWDVARVGSLNSGVSYDTGANTGGAWLGRNFVNTTTLFAPIFEAHSGGLEADEFEGFGPANAVFLGDDPPAFVQTYRSDLESAELNLLPRCYVPGWNCGGWRVGVGYGHSQLDEFASTSLTGTYRAVLDLGPANGGIVDASLTGAGLNLIAGLGNGFSDASGNQLTDGNPLVADTLVFSQAAAVTNELNGFQLIYDAQWYEGRRFSVNSRLTGGIYRNSASGILTERYSDEDSTYGRDFVSNSNSLAYAGSVNMVGKYWMCDWLAVSGGYEVSLISRVALATEQVAVGSGYSVNTAGDLFVHGARFGLEARF